MTQLFMVISCIIHFMYSIHHFIFSSSFNTVNFPTLYELSTLQLAEAEFYKKYIKYLNSYLVKSQFYFTHKFHFLQLKNPELLHTVASN